MFGFYIYTHLFVYGRKPPAITDLQLEGDHLTRPTFYHFSHYLDLQIETSLFVMDLYDSVSVTVKDLYFALMTTLFGEWCSGRLVMKMSMSQFFGVNVHIGHHRWIWPFASCATFQPHKMTFIYSYLQVIPHLCIFTTLHWVFHFIVFLHDVHIQLTSVCHCHSITLCTPMHYQMHYIRLPKTWFRTMGLSSLFCYLIFPYTYNLTIYVYHIVLPPFHTCKHLLKIISLEIPLLYL